MKKEIDWKKRIAMAGAGLGAGAVIHHCMATWQDTIRPDGRVTPIHGTHLGIALSFIGLITPESQWKYLIYGLGAGMTVDDVIIHYLQKQGYNPLYFGDEDIKRYYKFVHINERLPPEEKERIILPMFSEIVSKMRDRPEQRQAIARIKLLAAVSPGNNLTMDDVKALQSWILKEGRYTSNEALWYAHDRFRTAAKLVEELDHGDMEFDCDDWGITFNQIVDSYNYPTYFVLISQVTVPAEELDTEPPCQKSEYHLLHHVLPAIKYQNQLWLVEGIKYAPIIPIKYAGLIFDQLKRVVIVYPDGNWKDYHGWKHQSKLAQAHGTDWETKYPYLSQYLKDVEIEEERNVEKGEGAKS